MSNAIGAENHDKISPDRPDFVDSSDVVGKGRFQIEAGVAVQNNRDTGSKDRTITLPVLLRAGVSQDWEVRLSTDSRTIARTEDIATGVHSTQSGYGDLSVGAKWHLMDGENFIPAIGLIGEVAIDSGSRQFRGNGNRPSLRMAAEWELPHDFSLGVMPGIKYDKNNAGSRFTSGMFGVVLDKSWNDRVSTFVELSSSQIARSKDGGTFASFDIGATYMLTNLLQVDTGIFKGLNNKTPDLTWTIGLSAKF